MKRLGWALLCGCAAAHSTVLVDEGPATHEVEVCSLEVEFDAPGQGRISASVRAAGPGVSGATALFDWGLETPAGRVAQGRVMANPELRDGCLGFDARFVVREQNWKAGAPGRENAVFKGALRTATGAFAFSRALRLDGAVLR